MKYESNTKVERNKAVIDFAKNHPDYALAEIAQVFNISRQRVFQILKRRPKNV